MEKEGYRVEAVEDGDKALEAFKRQTPQLVILDVLMPGANGYEVCRAIRQLPDSKYVPILMATGLEDIESINQAYDAGATDFVSKPLNWLILAQRVRYMLRASQAMNRVQKNEKLLANAQKIARICNWEWDLVHNQMQWSAETYRLFNLSPDEISPSMETLLKLIHPDSRILFQQAIEKVKINQQKIGLEVRLSDPGYSDRHLDSQTDVVIDKTGKPLLLVGTFQDISERKKANKKIHFLASYDPLTGLPNRTLFSKQLDQAITRADRQTEMVGIVALGIDRFKRINDSFGHKAGDQILQEVGTRLRKAVLSDDNIGRNTVNDKDSVARRGGDEFSILFTSIRNENTLARMAKRLQVALQQPFTVKGEKIFLAVSMGVAVFPADGNETQHLLKNCDAALNHAKSSTPGSFQFYSESINKSALEQLKLENDLRTALTKAQFELYYQPQVHLTEKRISGTEALIRWQHPDHGLIPPFKFIPLAEDTGLINDIGKWVIETACTQQVNWHRAGLSPVRVSVNISSVQFHTGDLIAIVKNSIRKSGIDPHYLELELTESIIINESNELIETMRQLKRLGVRLVVDDFGTGYSSLRYLKQFPIDGLKIDRSFVKNIPGDENDAALSMAIMYMAKSLKLDVVVEGVETKKQFDFFVNKYCKEIQGYLFSQPVPARAFKKMLERNLFQQVIG